MLWTVETISEIQNLTNLTNLTHPILFQDKIIISVRAIPVAVVMHKVLMVHADNIYGLLTRFEVV